MLSKYQEHVHKNPTHMAVKYKDEQLSYQQHHNLVKAFVEHLKKIEGVAHDIIGVYMEPSIDLMVAIWGVVYSGGAYLPLSPEYPEARLQYMIEDSQAKIIITQAHLKSELEAMVKDDVIILVYQELDLSFSDASCAANYLDNVVEQDLAYVIYTSGSTGRPKGVMIEHQSINHQLCCLKEAFSFGSHSVILQKTPMSFDAAQWEILALAMGCSVVVGEPGIYKDPIAMIEAVKKYQITTLQCVPTLLQALLDTTRLCECGGLEQLFVGGEAFRKSLLLDCWSCLPECEITNLYGPTEATINVSWFKMQKKKALSYPNVLPIGKAIAGMEYKIVNDAMEPLGVGQTGELWISGIGLARGYLNNKSMSNEKFVSLAFDKSSKARWYKTGDLAYFDERHMFHFVARKDNQVKLRGYRVELDEISASIAAHDWVKHAAVVVQDNPRTGIEQLMGFIELDAQKATLMDQGSHGVHHQSKASRTQVKLQLDNALQRDKVFGKTFLLPGAQASQLQENIAFARKTYRYFKGESLRKEDLISLFTKAHSKPFYFDLPSELSFDFASLGYLLRYFGQFKSSKRLLPKYSYASPGALYATMLYVQIQGVEGIDAGYYYYNPVTHALSMKKALHSTSNAVVKFHFIGDKSAIEPVYKNNIKEVLEIETGHMVGMLEILVSKSKLMICPDDFNPLLKKLLSEDDEDYYLGSFELKTGQQALHLDNVDIYVQAHGDKISGLDQGLYQCRDSALVAVSKDILTEKQVIAINQRVYKDAAFGVHVLSCNLNAQMKYIDLGRALQKLQMNGVQIGLMSSGYSSDTGHNLPSANWINTLLKRKCQASYFFLGAGVSQAQILHRGMDEDAVHMKGPAEMIQDDLKKMMPDFMVPNKIEVIEHMPLSVNGKIDLKSLKSYPVKQPAKVVVPPSNAYERTLLLIWEKVLKIKDISVEDNFFELGGNSLLSLMMVRQINQNFKTSLAVQVLFKAPTIAQLAQQLNPQKKCSLSRLISLNTSKSSEVIYCWPGLGGYPMNLRLLASKVQHFAQFYGVQAYGINPWEQPFESIQAMAKADVEMILAQQSKGPYSLWGYSFGAKVAFEVAYQLEQMGHEIAQLILIAPGSPLLDGTVVSPSSATKASWDNKAFVAVLFSVFNGGLTGPLLKQCLRVVVDKSTFVDFILAHYNFDLDLVESIVEVVALTYDFKFSKSALEDRNLKVPISIYKTEGDAESFLDARTQQFCIYSKNLATDHYSVLQPSGIDDLWYSIVSEEKQQKIA